ncbi:MAG: hypothetical protein Q9210_005578 [Variospora velana]
MGQPSRSTASSQQDGSTCSTSSEVNSIEERASSVPFPLFCTTDVPIEFLQELDSYTSDIFSWAEILTSDPGNARDPIQDPASLAFSGAATFRAFTLDELYEFHKAYLRPADNLVTDHRYSYFGFIVIDESCLVSEPWECIICCDAPDFGEATDEVTLKQVRMDFEDTATYLPALEELIITPDEFEDKDVDLSFEVVPPPSTTFTETKGEYRLVSPAQARQNKRRALLLIEEAFSIHAQEDREVEMRWRESERWAESEGPTNQTNVNESSGPKNEIRCASNTLISVTPPSPSYAEIHGEAGIGVDSKVEPSHENEGIIVDPAEQDITITTDSKLDMTWRVNLHRHFALGVRSIGGDSRSIVRFIHDNTEEFRRREEEYDARHAAGPTRPIYTLSRPVYGPVVEGREKPVIDSPRRGALPGRREIDKQS